MKKLNKKGFTLIELLAVIVIMGILMLVAIPAISRYITNSRKDTYVNTVKEMVNVAKNANADRDSSLTGCDFSSGNYTIYMESKPPVLDNETKSPMNNTKPITVKVTFANFKVSTISASDEKNGFSGLSLDAIKRDEIDSADALSKANTDCEIAESN